jgi:Protein of unknown function (DUF4238)
MTVHAPIRHHFVPVFYQSEWAVDHRVTRYSRPHDVVVASDIGPKYTGYEEHLYALQGVSPDQQQWLETYFFAPLDSRAALAHQLMLDGKVSRLTNAHRVDWARFMMSMQLRGPLALAEVKRLAQQNMRASMEAGSDADYESIRKSGDPDTFYGWMEKYQPLVLEEAHKRMLPGLIDHESIGQYLINMHWQIIDLSDATNSLLTGDRPFINTHGLKHPHTAVVFPLSPDRLFVATNGHEQAQQVLAKPRSWLARWANDQIVRCAVDFVIGTDDSHLLFVERRLRKLDQEPVPGPVGKGRPDCPQ